VQLRRATLDDAATLARLSRWVHDLHVGAEPEVYVPAEAAQVEAWARERLAAPGVRAVVAELDGAPVGYVVTTEIRRAGTPLAAPRAFLLVDELAVAPTARRRGVGRALMDAAHGLARASGLPRVELDVRSWNEAALGFYRALGYAPLHLRLGRAAGP
jgi:ribosomal protein S18 acetylase RimI-like enzyme